MLALAQIREQMEGARDLQVSTPLGRQVAADLWDAIRAFRKQAEAQKEEICRPLKAAYQAAKKPFDEFVAECAGHEATLAARMAEWDREQARLAAERQAAIQARIDAQNARAITKAEARGLEPVLKIAPVVPTPPRVLTTQAGTQQSRQTVRRWTIAGLTPEQLAKISAADTRLAALPREWLLVNVAMVSVMVRAGLQPECVEVREDTVYVQRGRAGNGA